MTDEPTTASACQPNMRSAARGDDAQARRLRQRRRIRRPRSRAGAAALAPLLDEVEPVDPPADLWARIALRTGGAADTGNVVVLRRRVSLWRAATGGMTALAASLALVLLQQPQRAAAADCRGPGRARRGADGGDARRTASK